MKVAAGAMEKLFGRFGEDVDWTKVSSVRGASLAGAVHRRRHSGRGRAPVVPKSEKKSSGGKEV